MPGKMKLLVVILVAVAVAAFALVLRYVPFYAPSFLAWAGIVATLAGIVSVVRPLRFLGVRTRWRALALVVGGVSVAVTALLWPATVERSARQHQRIDDLMPSYRFAEYHEVRVRAPLESVVKAAREVSLADMPVAVLLMRIRAAALGRFHSPAPDSRPLLEVMLDPGSGFIALDVADHRELVYGMAGFVSRPRPPVTTPEEFAAFTSPDGVRVAFNLCVVPEEDGMVRVSTETRCLANGDAAQRVFAVYWRLVYPGSAIIRRVWLDAIVTRAKRDGGET